MKKIIFALSFLLSTGVIAASSNVQLDKAEYDLTDKASLQSGAQLFMNYCLGCHQTQYQRYQRTFEDLGIPLELGQANLQLLVKNLASILKMQCLANQQQNGLVRPLQT